MRVAPASLCVLLREGNALGLEDGFRFSLPGFRLIRPSATAVSKPAGAGARSSSSWASTIAASAWLFLPLNHSQNA